ncbi:MAG TPA: DinB family protein [Candidatus Saccharimonadales bacterium]|nr:DinB family protein [Candidatus Saccharimonadales bacterium]
MDEAIDAWIFARSETRELLKTLDDQQLLFTPQGDKWQPLYYQFACMVRTQLVYAKALQMGVMDNSYFDNPSFHDKHDLKTRMALETALDAAVPIWKDAIATGNSVNWYGKQVSTAGHIYHLISHERLHHGQLISYFTLAGYELPQAFKQNWAL